VHPQRQGEIVDEASTTGILWPAIELPLEFEPGIVHVIRVSLDLPQTRWTPLTAMLSDDEQLRAARFQFDEPRQRFVICRATLRQLLGNTCGIAPEAIRFRYGDYGKPELDVADPDPASPRIEFSVSHSSDLGLIAIARGSPVGVDIEYQNPSVKILRLAERFFAPAEATVLRNLTTAQQLAGFYRGWTCKEAYLKATGRGLSLSLSSFCVAIEPDQPAALRHVDDQPEEPGRWTIQSLDVAANYAAAVMVARPDCRVQCRDWSPR
jgi:4'-phosphopantetheinyl transferase